jgi:probable F420-dependent oxidoreductase
MKVRIGVAIGGQRALPLDRLGPVIDDLDRLGFDSIWVPEFFTNGGYDPLVVLSFVAGRTRRLKIGTHLVAPGRNVVQLAKSLANLDVVSGGRLLLVFVPGVNEAVERQVQGMPAGDRNRWFDEHLPTLRALWRGDEIDGVRLEPTPKQQPLEVWFGGKATSTLERAGRLSDGWLGGLVTVPEAIEARTVMTATATAAGRAISPEHFGINLSYTLDTTMTVDDVPRRQPGDASDVVAFGLDHLRLLVGRWVDEGFSKVVVRPVAPPDDWHAELEALAECVVGLQT